jgi:hypothetical protein
LIGSIGPWTPGGFSARSGVAGAAAFGNGVTIAAKIEGTAEGSLVMVTLAEKYMWLL